MQQWTRKPAVAGRFYAADSKLLRSALDELCGERNPNPVPAVGAMVPHAGYIYSGQIAINAFKEIAIPENIIIVCPNHTGRGKKISVWERGDWETPFGFIPVHAGMADTLLQHPIAQSDKAAHASEHAIEVQLPLLKYFRQDLKILPIVLGPLSLDDSLDFATHLAKTAKTHNALLVASTDMSHYVSAFEAMKKDELALSAIKEMDPKELYNTVCENEISMCGFIPTTCVLEAVRQLGASKAHLLSYGNSGEKTQDFDSVVAYASGYFV